jgi:hypothetical protein
MEILFYVVAMFALPFLGIVAGAHYEHWLNRKHRRRKPRVMDCGNIDETHDWRGL